MRNPINGQLTSPTSPNSVPFNTDDLLADTAWLDEAMDNDCTVVLLPSVWARSRASPNFFVRSVLDGDAFKGTTKEEEVRPQGCERCYQGCKAKEQTENVHSEGQEWPQADRSVTRKSDALCCKPRDVDFHTIGFLAPRR